MTGSGVPEDSEEFLLRRRRRRRIAIMITPKTATPPSVVPRIASACILLGVGMGVGDIVGLRSRLEIKHRIGDVVDLEGEEREDDEEVEAAEDSSSTVTKPRFPSVANKNAVCTVLPNRTSTRARARLDIEDFMIAIRRGYYRAARIIC